MIYTAWVFEEKWKAQDCLTHDFAELVRLSGLTAELNAQLAANPAFVANWGTALPWKVTTRYLAKSEAEARTLYAAITDDPDGMMKWIQYYW
jgi:hypothetical protein